MVVLELAAGLVPLLVGAELGPDCNDDREEEDPVTVWVTVVP